MKALLLSVTALIFYFGFYICCVWSVVEFILYLVKDKEFNWWSLWSILICVVISFTSFVFAVILSDDSRQKPVFERSSFQERLEEIAEQCKEQKQCNQQNGEILRKTDK